MYPHVVMETMHVLFYSIYIENIKSLWSLLNDFDCAFYNYVTICTNVSIKQEKKKEES